MTALPKVEDLIDSMTADLKRQLAERGARAPVMIGIHSGGVWVAERLHRNLAIVEPLGTLDISFYRDDFSRAGLQPQVRPSHLPFEVEGRTIILVDDVLYTGRTIRAALNVIFDYGRPASVLLAVLVDRGERELPVAADVTGARLQLPPGEHIKLTGPEPLTLVARSVA